MFYGWRIVGVTFVTQFISVGLVFYSYGVFFKALAADFGGSRLGVAVGLAIMNGVIGLLAPFLGYALDRRSIRHILCLGALLSAAGFFLAGRIGALWQFYFLMGSLVALGVLAMGPIAGSTLVANWFTERRGTALGVAGMGISLSGMVMAPLATVLIASLGWRSTFLVYGAVPLIVVLPLVWAVVVNRPEQIGLRPDGVPGRLADVAVRTDAVGPRDLGAGTDAWSPRDALGEPNFWVIVTVVALNSSCNGAVLTHIIPHATDIGLAQMQAAWVLSCIAGFGVLGKVVFGWTVDRIDKRRALWLATALQAIGVAWILNVERYSALLAAGTVYGLGMGGMAPLWGAAVGAGFGRHRFGRVTGLMNPFMLPIRILGIPYAGWIFDRTGSYAVAFLTFLGAYALSMVVTVYLRLPAVEPGTEGPD